MQWLAPRPAPQALSDADYEKRAGKLREALLQAQNDMREDPFPAVVVLAGVDGAGKGESVNLLSEWMDPRFIRTHGFHEPSDEESERPRLWRYWRVFPPRGNLALLLSAWYLTPLLLRVGEAGDGEVDRRLEENRRFEAMLCADGCVVLKLWLHLDRAAQEQRLRELAADPLTRWRVTDRDWEHLELHERFGAAAEEILDATHTDAAPWHVVDGRDPRQRGLAVGGQLLDALRARLDGDAPSPPKIPSRPLAAAPPITSEPLREVDKDAYRVELALLQGRLNRLHRRAREADVSLVAVFEGRDAAGKGGAIRRLMPAMDARAVAVERIGPPSDEEAQHPYLWRFWRRLPRAGRTVLFDRSWYGRVLVERVEELARKADWRRAYPEIVEFERQLVDHGIVFVKFWLEISKKEQKRRFEERRKVPYKRWKLTPDDLRNRGLWDAYDEAIEDMLARTHTARAPWTVVPANDKRTARLQVLRTVCEALEARLGPDDASAA